MKFSIFMMPLHHPTENPSLAFDRDISLIQYADELGFDEFFIGEHHSGGWETMPAPEMVLAKASAQAHRIRLGTSVISVPFHHPFHVAERMAFLDHLTRGRAILGVGPCALVTDKKLFGLPNEKLYPMLAESVDIIVRLLESADPIDYEGRFWSFKQMRLQLRSYQQPRMPLAIASSGNAISLELAGKHGMLFLSPAGKNIRNNQSKAEQWNKVEAIAAKHGTATSRDNWRIATCVYLADSKEEAWRDVEASIARDMEYFASIGLKAPYESYPGQPLHEITARSGADRRDWIIGTPEDAIKQIERMQAETGGFGGLLLSTHEWAGTEKLRRSYELFARYVIPHFRGHTAGYRDEWRRIQEAVTNGGVRLDEIGQLSNLAMK
ncbi:MAG TPA: LLM class flavin-dependent oxidoreductase [Candidatus Saccharimonadales bacterium]|nr:LLM class flavin-dependent oxidoreductase [Candidatus Saccharimonadales bacterium]